MLPSPIDTIELFNQTFYYKRDDLIHPMYSGNKYRKLYHYFDNPSDIPIVSYGGYQSNAMLSLAFMCHQQNRECLYLCKTVPENIKEKKYGNLYQARLLGMQLIEVANSDYQEAIDTLSHTYPHYIIVKQGGATPFAKRGVEILADEIDQFMQEKKIKELALFLPSGTGTTALYLQNALPHSTVYTTACVGKSDYLQTQWDTLDTEAKKPKILKTIKTYHFAKPYKAFYDFYDLLQKQGVEIDLIYAPKMLQAIQENLEKIPEKNKMILHTGGVLGNSTQIARYTYKKLI
jgi:1-aminocyclopropane-1-carboxylate deaminase/D-cysteine desulfhydrase-like pyridoxal-dependent ACC family enzyme